MKKYDQYKNSGLEWLGEIPEHWELKKLKYSSSIYNGDSLNDSKKTKFESDNLNDFAYISSKDIDLETSNITYENGLRIPQNEPKYKVAPNESSLICIEGGSAGRKIAFLNQDICFVNKLACVKAINNVNSKFIYYTLKGSLFQTQFKLAMSGMIGGVAISSINNFYILNPPLEEQIVISNFLDNKTTKIDKAITTKQKQIELLKERQQIIIHNAITKGLDKTVKYKDSGAEWIGEIPEHWKVESLKNILTERNEKNAPIRTREILSLSIDKGVTLYAEKTTNLDRFKDDFSQYKLAHKDDLVFNSMNMIVGAVGVSDYFGCVSPVYYTYYGRLNYSNTKFYEYLFRCKTIQGVLYSLGKGLIAIDRGEGKYNTLRLKVSRDDLRSMRLPLPSFSEQNQIISYIETQSSKIDTLITLKEQEIEKLKEYKMSLIDGVVTGKVKVI
ncbi:restriction endonuclease subunit S [Flavobacterium lacus]|uniref:Type I restriction enzyme S subunit n=1 Tax=Flavobacterium lacus TaxID=1353778 RepID=A0A328WJB8_9FLAO|nr:restriction endonuclease subunit S [Flavobacterium lacus]RAR46452.1 type I restriction enzyme S subunit [Flavobacterium lacus]